MDRKSKIIIIIVLLLFIIASGLIYFQLHNDKKLQIDEITFSLPEGYHIDNKSSNISITNESNTFFIKAYNETNTTEIIEEYKEYKVSNFNETVNITNFKINNITVYKSNLLKDKDNIHYWFKYNNKTYTIYTWDADRNTDKIVKELVESIY